MVRDLKRLRKTLSDSDLAAKAATGPFHDPAGAVRKQTPAPPGQVTPDERADATLASTSYVLRRPRLVDLMHEESPSDITEAFLQNEPYEASSQPWSPARSATSPGGHSGTDSPAGSDASLSDNKSYWAPGKYYDDSVPWQKDAKPTNLLWQKIDTRRKEEIFTFFEMRDDQKGKDIWDDADDGNMNSMYALENHLFMHYNKDEFGKLNHLRFPPKPETNDQAETTPEDTRVYVGEKHQHMEKLVKRLEDADFKRRHQPPSVLSALTPRWLKSLFK